MLKLKKGKIMLDYFEKKVLATMAINWRNNDSFSLLDASQSIIRGMRPLDSTLAHNHYSLFNGEEKRRIIGTLWQVNGSPISCARKSDQAKAMLLDVGYGKSNFKGLKGAKVYSYYCESICEIIGLLLEQDVRKPDLKESNFTHIGNDYYGNPLYVTHYLNIAQQYNNALYIAKKAGGKEYKGKDFGGGIVFQSYDIKADIARIEAQQLNLINYL